jgi:hypothetical protein
MFRYAVQSVAERAALQTADIARRLFVSSIQEL